MRICPKCSKQVTDESQICRDCGAILDELPDDQVAEVDRQPETTPESSLPSEAGRRAGEPATGEQSPGDEVVPSLHERVKAGHSEAPAWKCPQCGETVPATFDQCWQCLTTEDGQKADPREVELLAQAIDTEEAGYGAEDTDACAGAAADDEDDTDSPSRNECPRCGSTRMMRDVMVRDCGEGSPGSLRVVVFGDPGALVFKDRLYGELWAEICGDCGHVELRVANPRELYRHYRKSVE